MRKVALMFVMVILGAQGVVAAQAAPRQAATDQYGGTPVIGSGGNPTPTVTPAGTGGSSGGGTGTGGGSGSGSGSGTGSGSGSGATTKGAATGAAAAATTVNRVTILGFGATHKKLRRDIARALTAAGLPARFQGAITEKRFQAFIASPLAKLLSAGGPAAAGRAFGAQLVNPTPVLRQAFPALFGPKAVVLPLTRVVLTRPAKLSKPAGQFRRGVAKGLATTDIPLAYVERSDAKKSFVASYKKLGVLTVSDIDKPAGKLRLGKIMLGLITTQQAVDAVKVKPASAITTGGGSTGTVPWILLAVLLGGVGFTASGVLRRRGRGRAVA